MDFTSAMSLSSQRTSTSCLYRSHSTTYTTLIVSSSPSPALRGADHPRVFKPCSCTPSLIATFPTRLLGEILWYILYNLDGTPVKDIEVKRIMLRSVSKHWMNAVDSNPFLWTALVLEDIDIWYKNDRLPLHLVRRFVRCSEEEPISISINASIERYPQYHRTFADVLMRQILIMLVGPQGGVLRRWNLFKFTCCDHFDVSLLEPLSLWPAPWLTGVEINCPGPYGGIIELNAPMLRWIIHHECTLFIAPRSGFFFMVLADLTLCTPPAINPSALEKPLAIVDLFVWLNIIRQAPRLFCLRLSSYFGLDECLPGPSEREEIIELSYLQIIFIYGYGPWKILQYFRFPALISIRIDGAMSDDFCSRMMECAQCYEHLSHIKHLWFRYTISYMPPLTVEEGHSFYGEFLARFFPEINTLIVPFYARGWSNQEALAFKKVQARDEKWKEGVFARLQRDTRFPNRKIINGGEKELKMHFEHPHPRDAPQV